VSDYQTLAKALVAPLVEDINLVEVNVTEDNNLIKVNVVVPNGDFGKLIGKNGEVANALRELINVKAKIDHSHVRVFIDVKK
jgi:predicted RNA-binding protein YlqC (UPF0109 family)